MLDRENIFYCGPYLINWLTLKDDKAVHQSADMILACKFPIYQGETGFFYR